MTCPSCQKNQPMSFRCKHCGAELMRGRAAGGRGASRAESQTLDAPPPAREALPDVPENPYATPQAAVLAHQAAGMGNVLASRAARLAAVLIDTCIAAVCMSPLLIGLVASGSSEMGGSAAALSVLGLLAFLALTIYQIRLLLTEGQTLGKKFMNIRIVGYDDGMVPPASKILLMRYALNSVLGNIPFYPLVDLLFIFGGEQRCIHDYLAGTKVVEA